MANSMSSTRALAATPVCTARRTALRPLRATPVMAVAGRRQESAPMQGLRIAVTGVAAGLLMHVGAAEAGVQMVKPETKKVFQADATATKKSAAPTAAKTKSVPAPSTMGGGPSVPQLAVPGSIAALGAFAAFFGKMDGGKFMDIGLQKDSSMYAGYEPDLKSDAGPPRGNAKSKAGAKKKKGFF